MLAYDFVPVLNFDTSGLECIVFEHATNLSDRIAFPWLSHGFKSVPFVFG